MTPNDQSGCNPETVLPDADQRELLAGQKAVVTGANSGIGRAIASALGRAGADVMINYHSDPDAADEADYIVGTTIYVDGGMMLYPGFSTGG